MGIQPRGVGMWAYMLVGITAVAVSLFFYFSMLNLQSSWVATYQGYCGVVITWSDDFRSRSPLCCGCVICCSKQTDKPHCLPRLADLVCFGHAAVKMRRAFFRFCWKRELNMKQVPRSDNRRSSTVEGIFRKTNSGFWFAASSPQPCPTTALRVSNTNPVFLKVWLWAWLWCLLYKLEPCDLNCW